MTFYTFTFCTRFVNSTSLAIKEKSYFTLSAHRPVTFVDVFGAPLKLADHGTVKRPEDFCECQEVNTYHNCHQGTNISNGVRTCSIVFNHHLPATLPYLGVFKFVCFTEISRKGAIKVIAVAISCVNALILPVLIVEI